MTESEGGTTLLFHSLSSEIIYATTVNHGVTLFSSSFDKRDTL
jgi:hypothetical protein